MVSVFQKQYECINGNIAAILAKRKMSVETLSRRSGISKSTLYQRRKDTNKYSLEELLLISRALGVSVSDLLKEC